MNDEYLEFICEELWTRMYEAHRSGEQWKSPDGHKDYYVESINERRLHVP